MAVLMWKDFCCTSIRRLSLDLGRPTTRYCSTGGIKDVLALDFDGVVCDSAHETSLTAIRASQMLWGKQHFAKNDTEVNLLRSMLQSVRPVVETGFENLLLCKYLYDSYGKNNLLSPYNGQIDHWQAETVQHILSSWGTDMRDSLVEQYGYDKKTLIDYFGAARDFIIASNPEEWAIKLNPLFSQVVSSLIPHCDVKSPPLDLSRLYIVTTKQTRFVTTILDYHKLSIVNATKTNLFGLENPHGPKWAVLSELCTRHPDSVVHFVEDRYETLLHVRELQRQGNVPHLGRVQLHLVDWGYSQPRHVEAAKSSPDINVLCASSFKDLVQRTLF